MDVRTRKYSGRRMKISEKKEKNVMRRQRIEIYIYAFASHMELRPTTTYSSLFLSFFLSERKRMQWQERQGKRVRETQGAKLGPRRPFVRGGLLSLRQSPKNIHPSNVEQLPSNGLATFFRVPCTYCAHTNTHVLSFRSEQEMEKG